MGVPDGLECFRQLQPAVEVLDGAAWLVLHRAGDRLGRGIEFDQQLNRCRRHHGRLSLAVRLLASQCPP